MFLNVCGRIYRGKTNLTCISDPLLNPIISNAIRTQNKLTLAIHYVVFGIKTPFDFYQDEYK